MAVSHIAIGKKTNFSVSHLKDFGILKSGGVAWSGFSLVEGSGFRKIKWVPREKKMENNHD
jgi:hypothetical protein